MIINTRTDEWNLPIRTVAIDQSVPGISNRVSLPTCWALTQDSAPNTTQTITKPAEPAKAHYATAFEVTVHGPGAGSGLKIEVTLNDGDTPRWKRIIPNNSPAGTSVSGTFPHALRITENTDLRLHVQRGGANVLTTANLAGYTA